MKLTLLDEQGAELTEITWRFGRVPGRVNVDWATRPDALFRYYFDQGARAVTAVTSGGTWAALLGTRWQMGARFWFLHALVRIDESPVKRSPSRKRRPAIAASGIRELSRHELTAGVGLTASTSERRGTPD